MFNLQSFNKHKGLGIMGLACLVIFGFSFLFHQITCKVYLNNNAITFDSTQLYINLLKFSKDTIPFSVSSIQTTYSIDSLNFKGNLELIITGYDAKGNRIFDNSKDAFVSIAANKIGNNSIRQVFLNDSINKKVDDYLIFLYNKGRNCGTISSIKIEIQ